MTKSSIASGFSFVAIMTVTACAAAPATEGDQQQPQTTKKVAPAPSSGSTASPGTSTSPTEPTACVPEGTKGNALGVGAYCSKTVACADGLLCTAPYAPVGAQFCTIVCSADADCGDGATCYHEARGNGCTPNACLSK